MAKIVVLLLLTCLLRAEPFGLTAKHPPLEPKMLKQLAYIGLQLTFGKPFCPPVEAPTRNDWEGGVLFRSDFKKKGKVFRKWLELYKLHPSKKVIVQSF